jgi:hypothetical protein
MTNGDVLSGLALSETQPAIPHITLRSCRPDGLAVRIGRVLGLPTVSDGLQIFRLYDTIVTAHPQVVQSTHRILHLTKQAAIGERHTPRGSDGDGFWGAFGVERKQFVQAAKRGML